MESFEKYQKQLLEQAQKIFYNPPISEATQKAYLETPRHRFVKSYREWGTKEWRKVNEDNLEEHLALLYDDRALILFGDDDNEVPSTISQPSFVLHMLDILDLKPGHKVFELGTGSGWNAALMGNLVGQEGGVYSLELIPELAQTAASTLDELGIRNVRVIEADGGDGYAPGAPYDRAIFTAGTYDLPHAFFEQVKAGGLLLIVIKNAGGGDCLFLLRKINGHFESIESMECGFVQMKGRHQFENLEPMTLESLPGWSVLKRKEIGIRPFWWGGRGKQGFVWRTMGIRSFLGITEPTFRVFKTESRDEQIQEEYYFGLWSQEQESLVVAYDDRLHSYGNTAAEERLVDDVESWVRLGMPGAASFALQVYPIDAPLTADNNQWIIKRRESQFLWILKS